MGIATVSIISYDYTVGSNLPSCKYQTRHKKKAAMAAPNPTNAGPAVFIGAAAALPDVETPVEFV
jgi:hypothetical protein